MPSLGVFLPRLGRRLRAGGSFLLIPAMTEQDFETYRDAVIQADQERCQQAYELAMAELGLAPCQHTKPEEFIDHLDKVTQLAREKFARLI